MNERIKELAEQAGYTPLPGFDFANSLQEVFIKNFAELIVLECAKVAGDFEYARLHDSLVEDKIKEHFGVEE